METGYSIDLAIYAGSVCLINDIKCSIVPSNSPIEFTMELKKVVLVEISMNLNIIIMIIIIIIMSYICTPA